MQNVQSKYLTLTLSHPTRIHRVQRRIRSDKMSFPPGKLKTQSLQVDAGPGGMLRVQQQHHHHHMTTVILQSFQVSRELKASSE